MKYNFKRALIQQSNWYYKMEGLEKKKWVLVSDYIFVSTFPKIWFRWKTQMKWVRIMVFNAAIYNISAILWWSVLLVEETGVPGENH